MIKRWGLFIILGMIAGLGYITFHNYRTLWDMILNIPIDLIISYILGGLTMYFVIFGRKFRRRKNKKVKEVAES